MQSFKKYPLFSETYRDGVGGRMKTLNQSIRWILALAIFSQGFIGCGKKGDGGPAASPLASGKGSTITPEQALEKTYLPMDQALLDDVALMNYRKELIMKNYGQSITAQVGEEFNLIEMYMNYLNTSERDLDQQDPNQMLSDMAETLVNTFDEIEMLTGRSVVDQVGILPKVVMDLQYDTSTGHSLWAKRDAARTVLLQKKATELANEQRQEEKDARRYGLAGTFIFGAVFGYAFYLGFNYLQRTSFLRQAIARWSMFAVERGRKMLRLIHGNSKAADLSAEEFATKTSQSQFRRNFWSHANILYKLTPEDRQKALLQWDFQAALSAFFKTMATSSKKVMSADAFRAHRVMNESKLMLHPVAADDQVVKYIENYNPLYDTMLENLYRKYPNQPAEFFTPDLIKNEIGGVGALIKEEASTFEIIQIQHFRLLVKKFPGKKEGENLVEAYAGYPSGEGYEVFRILPKDETNRNLQVALYDMFNTIVDDAKAHLTPVYALGSQDYTNFAPVAWMPTSNSWIQVYLPRLYHKNPKARDAFREKIKGYGLGARDIGASMDAHLSWEYYRDILSMRERLHGGMVPKVKSQYSLEDLQALYERIPKLYRERIEKWRAAQQRSIDDSLTPAQRQQAEEEATNLEQWLKGNEPYKKHFNDLFSLELIEKRLKEWQHAKIQSMDTSLSEQVRNEAKEKAKELADWLKGKAPQEKYTKRMFEFMKTYNGKISPLTDAYAEKVRADLKLTNDLIDSHKMTVPGGSNPKSWDHYDMIQSLKINRQDRQMVFHEEIPKVLKQMRPSMRRKFLFSSVLESKASLKPGADSLPGPDRSFIWKMRLKAGTTGAVGAGSSLYLFAGSMQNMIHGIDDSAMAIIEESEDWKLFTELVDNADSSTETQSK